MRIVGLFSRMKMETIWTKKGTWMEMVMTRPQSRMIVTSFLTVKWQLHLCFRLSEKMTSESSLNHILKRHANGMQMEHHVSSLTRVK